MLIKLTERSEHITGDVTYSHDNTKLTGDAAVYVSRKSRTLDALSPQQLQAIARKKGEARMVHSITDKWI